LEDYEVRIRVLGEWSVERDGRSVVRGANQRAILHALVLRREILRDDLEDLLPNGRRTREGRQRAIRNGLMELRKLGLAISHNENPVRMPLQQPNATVDLWDFFAHVAFERYDRAHELIARGQRPWVPEDDPRPDLWKDVLRAFEEARRTVVAAVDATTGRRRSMLATRERLLSRTLVPGVGRQIAIRDVRERLDPLPFPWQLLRPEAAANGAAPLPALLGRILGGEHVSSCQVVLVGPPGAGKTLTAISTFLRLTDCLVEGTADPVRTVVYADAHAEGARPDFGTDGWLAQRLREAGWAGHGRPVVIVPHADAFLSRHRYALARVLGWRLFADTDLLLCCSEQFYAKHLSYEDVGTHVLRLGAWEQDLQRRFAEAVFGRRTRVAFEAWREADAGGTRAQLCRVPLHLVHILPLVDAEPDALAGISTAPQLFDQVARVRLRVAGQGLHEDELLRQLASVAHRFYTGETPDRPISFTREELGEYLRAHVPLDLERRIETIVGRTLLAAPATGSDRLRFEAPSWGRWFIARHLAYTLRANPRDALHAFSKFLSVEIAELCEAMLREAQVLHDEAIVGSLRSALWSDKGAGLDPGRRTTAREKISYLLGLLGGERARAELAGLLDPSSEMWEPDPLVRRGIVVGLANGGVSGFADRYVDLLRAERDAGGASPERDANVGFQLSFRGDQPFDPARPGTIGDDPNPLRTIADLVRALEERTRLGSWRIKLFTLADLARHPAIPADRVTGAIAPHRDRLHAILTRLGRDPERMDWPEIPEVWALVEERRPAVV
jgi:hypothetical protein